MEEYLVYIWLGAAVLLAIVEALTVDLMSIWFMFGALAAFITAIFTDNIWVQGGVFLVVSLVLILFTRPIIKKRMHLKNQPTNADMLIGKKAQVRVALEPGKTGRVKVDGQDWAARCDVPVAVDDWCIINAIKGVTLQVSAVSDTQENSDKK